ncbi:MAG TPA: hypothetical protein VMT90_03200 [Dehalococcoidia bacterium]|nr:hypothetical protein [Dehalococcoidia bacterium]
MLRDSFSWWFFNFGVGLIWVAGAYASKNYFIAIGGLVYVAFAILIDLPGTSSEEGSADGPDIVAYPPESARSGPLHSESELSGGGQGTWRGSGPPQAGGSSQGGWRGSGPPPG